jgi:hypothetical protein
MKQSITIILIDGKEIIKEGEYSSEYELDKDIIGLGINGVIQKHEDTIEYFPPHRIAKIVIKKNI